MVHIIMDTEIKKMETILDHQEHARLQEEMIKSLEASHAMQKKILEIRVKHDEMLQVMKERIEKLVDTHASQMSVVCKDRDRYKEEVERLTRLTLDNDDYMDMLMNDDKKNQTAMCAVRPSTVPPRTVIIDTGSMGDVSIDTTFQG